MRYGLSDLLILTTGVALYAAAAGSVIARGGFQPDPDEWLADLLYLLLIAWFATAAIRSHVRDGAAILAFSRWYRWRAHGIVAIYGVGTLLLFALERPDLIDRGHLLPPALYHVVIEVYATVRVTDDGVYTGKLRRWKDWRFEVRSAPGLLLAHPEPNSNCVAPLSLRVPDTKIVELRAILECRQATSGNVRCDST